MIRIDCTLLGFEACWVDFRDDKWTFGDRRRITEAATDIEALPLILKYVVNWALVDFNGAAVAFDPGNPMGVLDGLDEALVQWLYQAWWLARGKRNAVPKLS